ncbi:MAG: hypothetical protein ACYS9X_05540 [Planctomycetota bacterium]|jgi:hypothetical protein
MRKLMLGLVCAASVSCGYVASFEPSSMAQMRQNLHKAEVQRLMGPPASTGMTDAGEESWEYREHRWSFTQGQRELVAVYQLRFRNDFLVSWEKTEGAQFRPAVDRGTTVVVQNQPDQSD